MLPTPLQLLDLTPFGRQETWEDSPAGWPQDKAGSWWRRDGRPIACSGRVPTQRGQQKPARAEDRSMLLADKGRGEIPGPPILSWGVSNRYFRPRHFSAFHSRDRHNSLP